MEWWVWAIIIGGAVLAVVLLVSLIGTPARRREANRRKANELRQEADERLASAATREAAARQEEAAAERDRVAADHAIREADAVDPDLPDAYPSGGPDVSAARREPSGSRPDPTS